MKAFIAMRYLSLPMLVLGSYFASVMPAYSQGGIPGYPDSVQAYDRREVALLPGFCLYTQSFRLANVPGSQDQRETDRWYARMGPTFHAMHHYCWGLMKTNRAMLLARNSTMRQFYLSDSITEFDYVIERAPMDFVLLPEVLTKKGENLIRLGMGTLGILELQRAIEIKPAYWPPFVIVSDYYKGVGDTQKSREFLEKGLSYQPDIKELKVRLEALDAANTKGNSAAKSIEPQKSPPGRPAPKEQPSNAHSIDLPAPKGQ